jgi:hypothetical protein
MYPSLSFLTLNRATIQLHLKGNDVGKSEQSLPTLDQYESGLKRYPSSKLGLTWFRGLTQTTRRREGDTKKTLKTDPHHLMITFGFNVLYQFVHSFKYDRSCSKLTFTRIDFKDEQQLALVDQFTPFLWTTLQSRENTTLLSALKV